VAGFDSFYQQPDLKWGLVNAAELTLRLTIPPMLLALADGVIG
jgi:hypothetical protein